MTATPATISARPRYKSQSSRCCFITQTQTGRPLSVRCHCARPARSRSPCHRASQPAHCSGSCRPASVRTRKPPTRSAAFRQATRRFLPLECQGQRVDNQRLAGVRRVETVHRQVVRLQLLSQRPAHAVRLGHDLQRAEASAMPFRRPTCNA